MLNFGRLRDAPKQVSEVFDNRIVLLSVSTFSDKGSVLIESCASVHKDSARESFCSRVNFMVKLLRADGGCLGTSRRRRTWQAAISGGEEQASCDPPISEWGNPREHYSRSPA